MLSTCVPSWEVSLGAKSCRRQWLSAFVAAMYLRPAKSLRIDLCTLLIYVQQCLGSAPQVQTDHVVMLQGARRVSARDHELIPGLHICGGLQKAQCQASDDRC